MQLQDFRDKVVLGMMIESKRAGVLGKTSRAAGFGNIPFDVLPTREMSATTPSAAENIQVATSAASRCGPTKKCRLRWEGTGGVKTA